MAVDRRYGRVTLEYGAISDDEPIVIFRAQDELLPDLLIIYAEMCRQSASPESYIEGIAVTRDDVVEWQDIHRTQVSRPSDVA